MSAELALALSAVLVVTALLTLRSAYRLHTRAGHLLAEARRVIDAAKSLGRQTEGLRAEVMRVHRDTVRLLAVSDHQRAGDR